MTVETEPKTRIPAYMTRKDWDNFGKEYLESFNQAGNLLENPTEAQICGRIDK